MMTLTPYTSIDVVLRWVGGIDVHLTCTDAAGALALLDDLTLAHNGTEQSVPLRDGWTAVALADRRELDRASLERWAEADRREA